MLALPEACRLFAVPYQRLWRAATNGAIHSVRRGKRLYVREADVADLVTTAHAAEPENESAGPSQAQRPQHSIGGDDRDRHDRRSRS